MYKRGGKENNNNNNDNNNHQNLVTIFTKIHTGMRHYSL